MKFEYQLPLKKTEPTPSDAVRWVTSYTFERHDHGIQLTTRNALCHDSACPRNWTRERSELVNGLLCWRSRLVSPAARNTQHISQLYEDCQWGKLFMRTAWRCKWCTFCCSLHYVLYVATGLPAGCRQTIHCIAVTYSVVLSSHTFLLLLCFLFTPYSFYSIASSSFIHIPFVSCPSLSVD